jgi:hypothetical protein
MPLGLHINSMSEFFAMATWFMDGFVLLQSVQL